MSAQAENVGGVPDAPGPADLVAELVVERLELKKLKEHPRNPRKHPKPGSPEWTTLARSLAHDYFDPIVWNRANGMLVSGHLRRKVLLDLGVTHADCVVKEYDEPTHLARMIAANTQAGEWLDAALKDLVLELDTGAFEMDLTGLDPKALEDMIVPAVPSGAEAVPEPPKNPTSRTGDLWVCGDNRVLCGDSTDPAAVARLMGAELAALIHADPPYGMGKEKDGVANDNLYEQKLDEFQMKWWRVWSCHLVENGSAYVWGNAPDLWRLWYKGGLGDVADLMFRNEIVWDKGTGFGMSSEGAHSYSPATERCIFFMRGQQFLGNQNIADYWEGYEPLRAWLEGERNRAGWTNGDVNKITESHMAGHWFTKSQFVPISSENYATLQRAAQGRAFVESYDDLFGRLFPEAKSGGNEHRRELSAQLRESRSFFDNTHDSMTDVWDFPRVHGEERQGHATPKPVALVARAIRSSAPARSIVAEPFLGSGSTLVAAAQVDRRCFAMELEPGWVDVSVARWQERTGGVATLEGDGRTFEQVAAERAAS